MNAIAKAVDEAKYRIPSRVLKEAFKDSKYSWRPSNVSIDEQITNKVIRSRVLVDCNLVGGVEMIVSLEGLGYDTVDNYTIVYHIPKERTQNRSIMSVKSVGYAASTSAMGAMGSLGSLPFNDNDMMGMANAVVNSHSSAPTVSTANVTLVAENTIMVRDMARMMGNNYLRCIVADDENMNHIPPRAIPQFCKLVELAVKSYVYNQLIIEMGDAFLSGGQELGVFKSVVEGYADSEQMYQDYLVQWSGVAFLSDGVRATRHIKLLIGAGI